MSGGPGHSPETGLIDPELVLLARDGDSAAFGSLYEASFGDIYDFLARMVRDASEAADLAQDTFLKAYQNLGGLREPEHFRSWLYTIARNTALNRIERRKRSVPVADDEMPEAAEAYQASALPSPEREAEMAEITELVWEAAEGLGERDASVLDLSVRKGLTNTEIAEVLGITPNNANVILARVRDRFAVALRARHLWRRGEPRCENLAAILAELGNPQKFDRTLAKAISRHADACPDCDETRSRLAPLAAFAAMPPLFIAKEAKAAVDVALIQMGVPVGSAPVAAPPVAGDGGMPAGPDTAVVAGGGAALPQPGGMGGGEPGGMGGGVPPGSGEAARGGSRAKVVAALVATVILALAGGLLLGWNSRETQVGAPTATATAETALPSETAETSESPSAAPSETPSSQSPTPTRTRTASPTPTSTGKPPGKPPSIDRFRAAPTAVTSGSTVLVTWTTSGADSVSITHIGSVSPSGSQVAHPTNPSCSNVAVSYVLTATNEYGSVTSSRSVNVQGPCPID